MSQCIVVLGTASIQRYVFQSNRLKENIGASHLAKYWLDEGLLKAIKQANRTLDTNAWDQYKADPSMDPPEKPLDTTKDVSLIYIGGGNAALLCKNRDIARQSIKAWSRKLLENAPGLRVAVGYADVTDSLAKAYRGALLDDLASCEEALPLGAALYSLPVVRTCTTTGLPASENSQEEGDEWISQSAASKRKQVGSKRQPGAAQKAITCEFGSVLEEGQGQHFAIKLDKLGGSEGESHIAVVHADGNGMGKYLREVVNGEGDDKDFLHHIRAFSSSVSRLSQIALKNTLQHLQEALPNLKDDLSLDKKIFPLRPIVYGGDDLTFVCDGRLGLDLAAFYLKEFSKGTINVCGKDKPVDACAGVAIVPTKFPFALAYHFAEELCGLTKSYLRQENLTGSWLDFQIIQEGATRSISALRTTQYRSLEGQKLHQRPYQVPDVTQFSRKSSISPQYLGSTDFGKPQDRELLRNVSQAPKKWDDFVAILKEFKARWPRSRAKGFLQTLTRGPTATQRFIEGAQWRGVPLPSVKGVDASTGWTGGDSSERTTPFFDPLEALDFYLEVKPATDGEGAGQGDKK